MIGLHVRRVRTWWRRPQLVVHVHRHELVDVDRVADAVMRRIEATRRAA